MEPGTVTELQMVQSEVEVLKSVLDGVKKAETKSSACASLTASVKKLEEADGFIVPAGEREQNPFHSTATGGAGGGGCCVVS